jgi:hypothetical protein
VQEKWKNPAAMPGFSFLENFKTPSVHLNVRFRTARLQHVLIRYSAHDDAHYLRGVGQKSIGQERFGWSLT